MEAWKRRVIVYQFLNVTALIVFVVVACAAILWWCSPSAKRFPAYSLVEKALETVRGAAAPDQVGDVGTAARK